MTMTSATNEESGAQAATDHLLEVRGLKKHFPIALRTSVPPSRMRNYQRKCMEHMKVLQEIGRRGDFSVYPTLVKKYKSHRNSELIRLGHISEAQVRKRSDWGKIEHARRVFGPTLAVMEMPDDV